MENVRLYTRESRVTLNVPLAIATYPTIKMHILNSFTALAAFVTFTMAQEAPIAPKMTLLYSMEALLGDRFSLGPIPTGDDRVVIPIVGGSFKGPKMNGTNQPSHRPPLLPHIQSRCAE